jgi:hypothetical protein
MKTHATVIAVLACVVVTSLASAADDGETIYAGDYPRGRHLVVVKKEIRKERGWEDKDGTEVPFEAVRRSPASTKPSVYPEHLYEYSFIVRSEDEARPQVAGKLRMSTMPGEVERMQFAILDAFVYDDQLVVLFRSGRATYADVAILCPQGAGFVMRGGPPLVVDMRESGIWVVGGRIEGSPTDGDLHAFVTTHNPTSIGDRAFRLVSKDDKLSWVFDPGRSR